MSETKTFIDTLKTIKWLIPIGILMPIVKTVLVTRPNVNKTFSKITIVMLILSICANIIALIAITKFIEWMKGDKDTLIQVHIYVFVLVTLSLIV